MIATQALVIVGPTGREVRPLLPGPVTVGRAEDNAIVLSSEEVSRYHATLEEQAGGWALTDLGSRNGTFLNGTRLGQKVAEPITAEDQIQIGPFTLHLDLNPSLQEAAHPPVPIPVKVASAVAAGGAATPPPAPKQGPESPHAGLALTPGKTVRIGRDPENEIVVKQPQASRHHAQLERTEKGIQLTDLNSTNGTFVNGQRISSPTLLKDGDTVQIATYRFLLRGGELEHFDDQGNITVQAIHLTKTVNKGLVILGDVTLEIEPREFVAIVGGSGAGKTTLMDALNGFRPATSGTVLYNGSNLYQNFDAFRNVIGYVPQDDIIHRELTVYGALNYAAQLRLPRDTTTAERNERIDTVITQLGLEKRRDTGISSLSGGQRKRVSIGVELLNQPSLIYLDEPTSGLDPSTETKMMRLMRDLADQGHSVVLVTHVTGNVSLCDKVIIMAPGGHLVFYGEPSAALTFFKVRDFVDIYDEIEKKPVEEWQAQYQETSQYRKYVTPALDAATPAHTTTKPREERAKPGFKHISALRQFTILSRRNLEILLRDRASLILMLLLAPLLGLLDFVTWKATIFNSTDGNSSQAVTVLFIAALNCILVGSLASMREIVKETEVYKRERMVGLGIVPYLGSKVWLGVVLAVYQGFMFVLFKIVVITSLPHNPTALGQMFITLTLTTLAGMMMGLFVSAVSPNQNVAPLLTILLLVPQIIFGGGLLPVNQLPNGELISKFMISKWGFDALVTISGMGTAVADDGCWQVATARADPNFTPPGLSDNEVLHRWQDTLSDDYKGRNCRCLGVNIFDCAFPGIRGNYTAEDEAAVHAPEPPKPAAPGNPPAQPASPPAAPASPGAQPQCVQTDPTCQQQLKIWQDQFTSWQTGMSTWSTQMNAWKTQMDAYKTQVDAYQKSTSDYQTQISNWQTSYKDWKSNRDKTISGAEAVVRKTFEDYGDYFKVNLLTDWGALVIIMAGFFGLILVAQKYKDVTSH